MFKLQVVGTSIATICHLQSYIRKTSPFRDPANTADHQDYAKIDGCMVELSTQLTLIHNNILNTLANIIDEDDLAKLLGDPDGKQWRNPLIERRAQNGLKDHCEAFCNHNSQLRVCLNALCEIFELPTPNPAESRMDYLSNKNEGIRKQKPELSTTELGKINDALIEVYSRLYLLGENFHAMTDE